MWGNLLPQIDDAFRKPPAGGEEEEQMGDQVESMPETKRRRVVPELMKYRR